jgi:hypothetical protein
MTITYGPKLGQVINAVQGEVWYTDLRRLLRSFDPLVQAMVKDKDLATPPGSPANGDAYIVATSPTGAWAGQAGKIAVWTTDLAVSAWEFYAPHDGFLLWVDDESLVSISNGGVWAALQAGIPQTLIDALGDLVYGSANDTAARLAGNITTTRKFLRQTGDGAASAAPAWDTVAVGDLPATAREVSLPYIIGDGVNVITTGVKGYIEVPFACSIIAARLLGDASGSIVIDIWKDTYANLPPTVGDTITASAKPTLSSAQKSQDTTLTGWTTSITAGDWLGFNVDSVTTLKLVTLALTLRRT